LITIEAVAGFVPVAFAPHKPSHVISSVELNMAKKKKKQNAAQPSMADILENPSVALGKTRAEPAAPAAVADNAEAEAEAAKAEAAAAEAAKAESAAAEAANTESAAAEAAKAEAAAAEASKAESAAAEAAKAEAAAAEAAKAEAVAAEASKAKAAAAEAAKAEAVAAEASKAEAVAAEAAKAKLQAGKKAASEDAAEAADINIQPKRPHVEAQLAAKYGAIDDIGDRAFAILMDLGLVGNHDAE
jgi:hypothetical protein